MENQNTAASPRHLSPGTVLHEQRYEVTEVLGEGGFGITYRGFDRLLNCDVAVKEFFPLEWAHRNAEAGPDIQVPGGTSAVTAWERGKKRFLEEAQAMAGMEKFPPVIGVKDFFEENHTAYIVMEYVQGHTLAEVVEERGEGIAPGNLFQLLRPLFPAISAFHESGMVHRDISPENLILESPGPGDTFSLQEHSLRLLDFGSARHAVDREKTLTITLKQGYAPVEQYQQKGQGPWTDVYALCATIIYCLTGKRPVSAVDRIARDTLRLPREYGVDIPEEQEDALRIGMALQPHRRFQTMQELYRALYEYDRHDRKKDREKDRERDGKAGKAEIEECGRKGKPDRAALFAGLLLVCILFVVLTGTLIARESSGGSTADELPEMTFPEIPETDNTEQQWPADGLADRLPVPAGGRLRIQNDTEEDFTAYVIFEEESGAAGKTEEAEAFFVEYVGQCKDAGFSVDSKDWKDRYSNGLEAGYTAFDQDGAWLVISLEGYYCEIGLRAPLEMDALQWPQSDLRAILPRPDSTRAKVLTCTQDLLEIYIGDTSLQDFNDYVDRCLAAGFSKSYVREGDSFSAENAEGYALKVSLEGYGLMRIWVDAFLADSGTRSE